MPPSNGRRASYATLQAGLLRALLRHAAQHTAYYGRVFAERDLRLDDFTSVADLAQLPLLDRDTLRATLEARTATAPPFTAVEKTTSGSSGEPVTVRYNQESRVWRDAVRWRGYGWAGYEIGNRALHYWGVVPATTTIFKQYKVQLDRALKRDMYVDSTPRDDRSLARAIDALRMFKPHAMVAYAAGAAALARYVVENKLRNWNALPVLTGAEALVASDRAVIGEAFGPAFDTYGCREVMLIGSECEHHDGMHTSMENMIVELVVRDADGTERAARPGEVGQIVVTDLHNLACPMIRYVTGDLATARDDAPCKCGRGLVRIGPIQGRVSDTCSMGKGDRSAACRSRSCSRGSGRSRGAGRSTRRSMAASSCASSRSRARGRYGTGSQDPAGVRGQDPSGRRSRSSTSTRFR